MRRRVFTRAFKLESVKRVKSRGRSVSQAARDLQISQSVLRRWVHEAHADPKEAFPGRGQRKSRDAEVARLRRELARMKVERDILKKHWLLRDRPDARFRTIAALRDLWPLRVLCTTFEVTRPGFYAWLKRPPSERTRADAQLTAIRRRFNDSDHTYGARRVRVDPLQRAIAVASIESSA